MKKNGILLLLLLLGGWKAYATHIVGADLTYTCLNAQTGTYRVELTMYRDCIGGQAGYDQQITLFVFNGDNRQLAFTQNITRPFNTPEIIPADWDVCTGQVYNLCVEYGTYATTITLPPRVGGYDIGWSRCCRNNAVTNIFTGGPSSQGITVIAHVPTSADVPGCNSSPRFRKLAPLFLCSGQAFNFDHSAIDPDGDSLVYVISNPYNGLNVNGQGTSSTNPVVNVGNNPMGAPPYQNVNYLPGYSFTNPFASGNFSIDPLSGLLTLTPTQAGLFVFAVSVLEYRNGVLLSENKRDFQINVVQCRPQGTPPVVNSNVSTTGGNKTIFANPNDTICYTLTATDPRLTDKVQLFPVSAVFGIGNTLPPPHATLFQVGDNPASGTICWEVGCNYAGQTVQFIVGARDTTDCAGYNISFDTVYVVVANKPFFNAPATRSACFGEAIQLNSAANGPGTVLWTNSDLSNPNTFTPGLRAFTPGYYRVSFTDTFGCITRDSTFLNILPLPQAALPPVYQICKNQSTATLNASGGVNYSWSPPLGLSDPGIANPLASPLDTTAYQVIVQGANGCQDTVFTTVNVNPLPIVDAGPDTVKCGNVPIQLQAVGGVRYDWSPVQGLSNASVNNPFANPLNSTRYYVWITDGNGCFSVDSVLVRTFYADAGPDFSICIYDTTTLFASGGVAYQWNPDPAILSGLNAAAPRIYTEQTRDFFVTVTDRSGCTDRDTVRLTVNPLPVISIAQNQPYVCSRGAMPLLATGGVRYVWDPDTTLNNDSIPNPVAFPTNFGPNIVDSTWYYVTVTDANGCVNRDSVGVEVRLRPVLTVSPDTFVCPGGQVPLWIQGGFGVTRSFWDPHPTLLSPNDDTTLVAPTRPTWYFGNVEAVWGCINTDSVFVYVIQPDAGPDATICLLDSVRLQARGGVSYQWTPALGLSDASVQNPMASPPATQLYVVAVTDSVGCTDTDTMLLSILPLPPADAGPERVICIGDTTQLDASGGVSYSWLPLESLSDPAIPNPRAFPQTTTVYSLTVTGANGCFGRDITTVTVNLLPIVHAGDDTTICRKTPAFLQATGAVDYFWSPTGPLDDAALANPVATPNVTTLFRVLGIDANGCRNTDSVVVNVIQLPVATGSPDDSICKFQLVELSVQGNALRYVWSTGETDTQIVEIPYEPTRYWVIPYGENDCPGDTVFINVYVETQLPRAAFRPEPAQGFYPLEVNFLNLSQHATRYRWVFGDGQIYTGPEAVHTYQQPGSYAPTLIVDNEIGCPDSVSFRYVEVWPEALQVPNAFSPNADGHNDEFFLPNGGIERVDMRIFDRWGKLIFSSTDPGFRWDGTFKGASVQEGVYVFYLKAFTYGGRMFEQTGSITLIR